MVHLRKDRVTAAWNATFPTVAVKDRTTDSRKNGLNCADPSSVHVSTSVCIVVCAHVGVHVTDVLPVAFGHLDDLGTDFDELTAT